MKDSVQGTIKGNDNKIQESSFNTIDGHTNSITNSDNNFVYGDGNIIEDAPPLGPSEILSLNLPPRDQNSNFASSQPYQGYQQLQIPSGIAQNTNGQASQSTFYQNNPQNNQQLNFFNQQSNQEAARQAAARQEQLKQQEAARQEAARQE